MDNEQNPSFFQRNSTLLKGLLIGVLVLLLLIPTFMIQGLIGEREGRKREAVTEVSSKWGNSQTLTGPVLRVPYNNGKADAFLYFLPEKLQITADAKPEKRYRGIFEVVVYQSKIKCKGSFNSLSTTLVSAEKIKWQNAQLLIGLDDLRGISDEVLLTWNGQKQAMNPGGNVAGVFSSGMYIPLNVSPNNPNNFEFDIALKGSQSLSFIPVGKTTDVSMTSTWQNPSFVGAFLPNARNISDKGFSASWKILHLNRNFPQEWTSTQDAPTMADAAFGVDLFSPNDGYQQTERSVKYAILIIALTFMVFFFNEMLNKKRVHPFQYVLIGLALCIFYTLLLAISEYLSFNWAYSIAAAMTLSLVFWYSRGILGETRPAVIILLLMGLLYGFVFTVIQLEDAALLVGTLGLFLILAIVMYISKKIDWYQQ